MQFRNDGKGIEIITRNVFTAYLKIRVVHRRKTNGSLCEDEKILILCWRSDTCCKNLVNRDFHADAPNKLWLTDITEFHIPAGKIYLSPMIDCFDGLPVTWTIGTSPSAELANTMLDTAIAGLNVNEHPIVHTDRGGHYRWPGWIERMDAAGLTRSMSKKGCSPDNAACEGFHGRLKNEFFYNRDWRDTTIDSFIDQLDAYIRWYSEKRIKLSLGGMSPLEYRNSLGLSA